MNGLSHRRSARPGSTPAPLQRRWSNVAGNRDAKMNPAKDEAADLALKIPILEAEILGLPAPRRNESESRGSSPGNGRSAPRPRPLAESGEVGGTQQDGTPDLVLRSGFARPLRLIR
jgi:hypothetical protein